jgi:hypothetical protein
MTATPAVPGTFNPAVTTVHPLGPIGPPSESVVERQDPAHTAEDFASDLAKATRRVDRS